MSWNGSSSVTPSSNPTSSPRKAGKHTSPASDALAYVSEPTPAPGTKHLAPSTKRGALAGLIVVALGGAALYFFTRPTLSHEPTPAKHLPTSIRTTITRVATPVSETGNPKLDEKIRKVNAIDRTVRVEVAATPETPEQIQERARSTKRVFSSGVEQLMSLMFTCKPGNMPFPLTKINDEDFKNLAAILISDNSIEEGDTDDVKYCKETVRRAKEEMRDFIRQGGDPNDFMAYYHGILQKDFEYRCEVLSMASGMYDDDPALTADFVKKMNAKFEEEGIRPIAMSDVASDDAFQEEETVQEQSEPQDKENKNEEAN